MDTPLRSKLLTVVLLRRAGGSLLRNPCPPSGPLEGWGPQAKRSGRDGAKRKVSGGRAAVRLAEGWTYAQRKSSRPPGGSVADSAGKAVGWPGADQSADQSADQGEDQDADQGADQGEDQGEDQGASQGANQGADQRCGQKMRTGLHFWCARP